MSQGRPIVSIGLPVYNGENFLRQALESLTAQTVDDLQIIIADNASTDGTEEICRDAAAADPRIEYHRHADNMGAPANYNSTVEKATGQYFMWAAHDDVRAPSFVERCLEVFESQPETAVVFAETADIDENGEVMGRRRRHDGLFSSAVHRRFRAAIISPHPSIIVFGLMRLATMKATRMHGSYVGADRVLAAELALQGPFAEVPEVLFFSREHADRYTRMGEGATGGPSRMDLWWNPDLDKADLFPRWRRYRDYSGSILRTDLSARDRGRCFAALAATLGDNRFINAKVLTREALEAAAHTIRRVARRRET